MKHHAIAPQQWFSAAELAALNLPGLATTKQGIHLTAKAERWAERETAAGEPLARKRQGRGGGLEYHVSLLPEMAQARLLTATPAQVIAERPDRDSVWMKWERLPAGMKAKAQRRLEIIQKVETMVRNGFGKARAVDWVVGEERRANRAEAPCTGTVYRWFAEIRGVDAADRLAYLTPNYSGRTVKAELAEEVLHHFIGEWLRASEPGYAGCYHRTVREAEEKGWGQVPSLKTLIRRLNAEVPRTVQLYYRKGEQALAHSFPHLERSRAGIGPLQIVNLDGHIFDIRVQWSDDPKDVGRPIILAVQDIATSKFLALRVDKTLNQHLVRLALSDTFRDYGIPEVVIMDNGRENAAKAISGGQETRWRNKVKPEEPAGLLKMLGIEAVFTTPYWGQAKPIERMFRDWATDLAKHPAFEGAYVGKDTASKPANYGERAVPIAEFERVLRSELAYYNARRGRAGVHLAGRSFDQLWDELTAVRPPKRATAEQLRLALMMSEPVRLSERTKEVKVMDHRYWSQELAEVRAKKVVVRFDPENLAAPVYVYSLDGRYLAQAERIAAGSFNNVAEAKRHIRERLEYQKSVRDTAKRARKYDAAQIAAMTPQAPPPAPPEPANSNVVTPAFGVPSTPQGMGGREFFEAHAAGVARLFEPR